MGNNFSSKYELFRNVKADDKKGLNKNYGIFLVLRRKTGIFITCGPAWTNRGPLPHAEHILILTGNRCWM